MKMDALSNLTIPAPPQRAAQLDATSRSAAPPAPLETLTDAYAGTVPEAEPGLYRRRLFDRSESSSGTDLLKGMDVPQYRADSGSRPVGANPATGSTSGATGPTATQGSGPAGKKDEAARRTEIMRAMIVEDSSASLDGKPDPALVAHHEKVMQAAMSAFPLTDLEAMNSAGVKIKFQHPPEGASTEPGGSYVPDNSSWDLSDPRNPKQLKHSATIYIDPRVGDRPGTFEQGVNTARHEFAHGKDDFSQADRLKQTGNHRYVVEDMASKSGAKVFTDSSNKQWSIQDMYKSFKATYDRDKSNNYIASKGTDHAHSAADAQEFFAEGYNVFHGSDATEWARLKRVAPQLYAHLHEQATKEGTLPTGIPAP